MTHTLGRLAAGTVLALLVGCSSGASSCAAPTVTGLPDVVAPGDSVTVTVTNLWDGCSDTGGGANKPIRGTARIDVLSRADRDHPIRTADTGPVAADATAELRFQIPEPTPEGEAYLSLDGSDIASFRIGG